MNQFQDEFWIALDAAVLRLEETEADEVDLEQFLLAGEMPWRQRLLVALVKIDQERCWRQGDPRRLEQYLERWPELAEDDELLAELVRAECRIRSDAGDAPDAAQLKSRFPDLSDRLQGHLAIADDEQAASILTDSQSLLATIGSGELFRRTANDPPALLRGHRLGRYCVLSVLGRGGMGTVYLARDEELDRLIAVKLLHSWIVSSDQETDSLLAEAQTAAKLRHPGIVPVYDVGRDVNGACFFVMEFVEGESLAELIGSGGLTQDRAVAIGSQIAEALAAAHCQGLVHRDVKPANILIDTDGRARITDFGLAVHEQDRSDAAGDVSGTLLYMAPEQVRGDVHEQDARTDLWALGVVLYEMLTGRRPFVGNSWKKLAEAIQNEKPPPPRSLNRGIPRALERLVLRCLNKESDGRHADAPKLLDDLHRIQQPSRVRRAAPSILAVLAAVAVVAIWIRPSGDRQAQIVDIADQQSPDVDIPEWQPPNVNIHEVPLHSSMAGCQLVFVAHIGAQIRFEEAEQVVTSQLLMTESPLYVSPSDTGNIIVTPTADGWLACEFPLSIRYPRGIPEGYDNQSSSGMGPDVISLRLRLAISPDGIFQFGTDGDDPNEHLLALMMGTGIDNSTRFEDQIPLPEGAVRESHNWYLETDERQNQFADWFAQTYRRFHENDLVDNGPRHNGELYECPVELRNFFEEEIIVVYGRIFHQQFDYDWYPSGQEWVDRAKNAAWSPIADEPDQNVTLGFDVNMLFPEGKPEHSALHVQCMSDNGNSSSFQVEGLTLDSLDRYHKFQAEPGENTSFLEFDPEDGTCMGGESNIAASNIILYGEAPTRIELKATTTWSIVHPWFKYATFGVLDRDLEISGIPSPEPQPVQMIEVKTWPIPLTHEFLAD